MNRSNDFLEKLSENRMLRHIVFWTTFYLLEIFQHVPIKGDDQTLFENLLPGLIFSAIGLISYLTFSYLSCYFTLPLIIKSKTRIYGIIIAIASIYLFSVLLRIMNVHVAEPLVIKGPFEQESFREILTDINFLFAKYTPSILTVAFLFIASKYLFNYEMMRRKDMELLREKSELELKALKSQLNPHFLFNTLNNIYSLSLENSPKTPQSIGMLSEMLDHILYKSEGKLVQLESEIDLIKNYIELEQLRYDKRLTLDLQVNVDREFRIPPLVLLSLVENAFKHGAAKDSGSPEIQIEINNVGETLISRIANSVVGVSSIEIVESIGLSNIRKQLDLIYDEAYSLDIKSETNNFTVLLSITNAE